MFLVLLSYKVEIEAIDEHIIEHRAWLDNQYATQNFILSGPQIPRTGGFILSHLEDRDALMDILAQDPFHRHDLAEYTVIELAPNKAHEHMQFLLK